jgi:hypothetical protein
VKNVIEIENAIGELGSEPKLLEMLRQELADALCAAPD